MSFLRSLGNAVAAVVFMIVTVCVAMIGADLVVKTGTYSPIVQYQRQQIHNLSTVQLVSEFNNALHSATAFVIAQTEESVYFITAKHAVEGKLSLRVFSRQGKEPIVIGVKDVMIHPLHDVAVIEIDRHEYLSWPTVDLDLWLKEPRIGEAVTMVGYPLAYGEVTSTGTVSYLSDTELFVDISAAPGNSGSAVVNREGKVIGILTSVYRLPGIGRIEHMNVLVPSPLIHELMVMYGIQD